MKKTTRMSALALVTAAGLTLTACGGSTGPATDSGSGGSGGAAAGGDCASEEVFCVGLVTDMGNVDDKSFNQSAWEGAQAAAQKIEGAQTKYIETTDTKDYASNLKQFTDAGYDVVITVGFLMAEATTAAAQSAPNTKFIAVDQPQETTVANVSGLVFPEDKAGYAAGYLAGLLTKTDKLGQVLGMKIPPVEKFALGFTAGAKAANPKASVATVYHPAGDNAFSDPVWGATTARQQLGQDVDVVFGAGGKTGNGALGEVAKASGAGTSVFCIGVDTSGRRCPRPARAWSPPRRSSSRRAPPSSSTRPTTARSRAATSSARPASRRTTTWSRRCRPTCAPRWGRSSRA